MWTLILVLNHQVHLSESYAKVYMMTCSVFYIETLQVHLIGSTSEGCVDHYGFVEEIKKFKLKLEMHTWSVTHGNTK
jgi:hypothetical protein